jgi:hypothetical protein
VDTAQVLVGLSYIFENQIGLINVKYITQILHDQFIQKWFSDIENSSRGEFYSLFKNNLLHIKNT